MTDKKTSIREFANGVNGYPVSELIAFLDEMFMFYMASDGYRTDEGDTIVEAKLKEIKDRLEKQVFPKIEIDGVLGNHGRLYKKKRYKRHYQNWDYIFYQFLGMFLSSNPQINWRWAKSPFLVKKIYNWEFLTLHGDDIQSWMGIPWYGIERAMWKLGDLLQSKGHNINYRLLGHFHNTGELDRITGEILINGSMIGGTEFSLGRMFTFNRPTQVFFGINSKIGLTWRFPLRLDLPDVAKVKPYRYNMDLDAGQYLRELIEKGCA